jgi:hypothetical protein
MIHEVLGDTTKYGDYIRSLVPEAYDKFLIAYPYILPIDIDMYLTPNRTAINVWGYTVGNSSFNASNVDSESPESKRAKVLVDEWLVNVRPEE